MYQRTKAARAPARRLLPEAREISISQHAGSLTERRLVGWEYRRAGNRRLGVRARNNHRHREAAIIV